MKFYLFLTHPVDGIGQLFIIKLLRNILIILITPVYWNALPLLTGRHFGHRSTFFNKLVRKRDQNVI